MELEGIHRQEEAGQQPRGFRAMRPGGGATGGATQHQRPSCEGRRLPSTSMTHLDRITTNPAICHGKPTVRGLRYPVEVLLESLASGMSIEEILEDYPDLERDDLLAALEFGISAL